jgi:hypothetical protein
VSELRVNGAGEKEIMAEVEFPHGRRCWAESLKEGGLDESRDELNVKLKACGED